VYLQIKMLSVQPQQLGDGLNVSSYASDKSDDSQAGSYHQHLPSTIAQAVKFEPTSHSPAPSHSPRKPEYTAQYLAELLKDKKQVQAFPGVFTHVERMLDDGVLTGNYINLLEMRRSCSQRMSLLTPSIES
jgi:hypothetical protein